MADQEDVTAESAPSPDVPASPGVIGDRPIQNITGEFNRKIGALEQKLDALTTYLANQAQPAPAPVAPAPAGATDDELWARAQAGDKDAFLKHQERQAARTYMKLRGAESEQAL